jgi:hypothetical protein
VIQCPAYARGSRYAGVALFAGLSWQMLAYPTNTAACWYPPHHSLQAGLTGMRVGGKREFIVPPGEGNGNAADDLSKIYFGLSLVCYLAVTQTASYLCTSSLNLLRTCDHVLAGTRQTLGSVAL